MNYIITTLVICLVVSFAMNIYLAKTDYDFVAKFKKSSDVITKAVEYNSKLETKAKELLELNLTLIDQNNRLISQNEQLLSIVESYEGK